MSVFRNIHAISDEFLIEYFGTLPNYIVLDTFELLLRHSHQNKSTVINIAAANTKKLGIIPVLTVFERLDDQESAFSFLEAVLPESTDK